MYDEGLTIRNRLPIRKARGWLGSDLLRSFSSFWRGSVLWPFFRINERQSPANLASLARARYSYVKSQGPFSCSLSSAWCTTSVLPVGSERICVVVGRTRHK